MKKLTAILLAFALAASLSLTAFAEETGASETPEATEPAGPVRVWGKVTPWDGEGVLLKNDNKDDPMNEVVVHLGDAPVVDAAAGVPLDKESIKEGDTLYAWVGPAMTMSLPPQASAVVAVGNIPADAAAPEYYVISGMPAKNDGSPAKDSDGSFLFRTVGGETLKVTDKTTFSPWLTRQIVKMEDLIPGTQVLVWKNADGAAEKVLVFAYAYEGYVNTTVAPLGTALICVNGDFNGNEGSQFECKKTEDGIAMAPVRKVAEAAGYDVRWDRTLGAVVSKGGETVLSVKPDAVTIQTSEGDVDISAPCILENGVTYLPAEDLAMWLNLFFTRG